MGHARIDAQRQEESVRDIGELAISGGGVRCTVYVRAHRKGRRKVGVSIDFAAEKGAGEKTALLMFSERLKPCPSSEAQYQLYTIRKTDD